jgi:succinate dehydrogenase/fumarate reductase flavoprotein subunit
MTQEILENRGCGDKKDHIYLQLHHLPNEILQERLPGIMETAKIFAGVDVTKEPVPVLPTVHYNMGGIPTNYNGEVFYNKARDTVKGLYAVGEAACVSVHGANRLGANSLLDLVVFGRSTGKNIVEKYKNSVSGNESLNPDNRLFDTAIVKLDQLLNSEEKKSNIGKIRTEMQETMQKYASVYKSKDLLETGYQKIKKLYEEEIVIQDNTSIWNTDLIEALELRNMLDLANVTVGASLYREESRGSHYRYDFPERNDKKWMFHTLSHLNMDTAEATHKKAPVNFHGLYPDEMDTIPAAKRVY